MVMFAGLASKCLEKSVETARTAVKGLIVGVLVVAQGCSAAPPIGISDPVAVGADPFAAENTNIIASGVRPDVIFIGDSVTHLWHHFLPQFFDAHIVERGVLKQTSAQILARFPDDVIALHPKVVHILAGTNDLFGTTSTTDAANRVVKNVAMMVEQAKAARITVIVAGVLPMTRITWRAEPLPADRVQTVDNQLRVMASREGVDYVDYSPAMDDGAGGQQMSLTQDGVHPNALGYQKIEPLARRAIAQALTEAR